MLRNDEFISGVSHEHLTDSQKHFLDVASTHHADIASRDNHIKEQTGLTPDAFFQRVAGLVDMPEAISYAPGTIAELNKHRG